MTAAYRFTHAIAREPSQSVVDGLRAASGADPSYSLFLSQHQAYQAALREAGVEITVLPALEGYPDAVFVEDTALCFPGLAVVLSPGAPTRQGEEESIAKELASHYSSVLRLPVGHVDGGDVLWTGEETIIGVSARTTIEGAHSLRDLFLAHGLPARVAHTPPGVLHFKSDSSLLGEKLILSTRRLAESRVFDGYDVVLVPDGDEAAANCIRVNDVVLVPAGYPRTVSALEQMGLQVVQLDNSEPAKIDGGLSCMSLRLPRGP